MSDVGRTFFLALVLAVAGCGLLADKGEESRGMANLPSQGIGPWVKYDQECVEEQDPAPGEQPNLDLQPILIRNPAVIPLPETTVFAEPWAFRVGRKEIWIYYEERTPLRSVIRRAVFRLGPGVFCRPVSFEPLEDIVVFEPLSDAFEKGRVGAPTVLTGIRLPGVRDRDTPFAMYYAGGDAAGIGLAVSDDGVDWTRIGPDGFELAAASRALLAPANAWERGTMGSPAVLQKPSGELLLYYDANRAGSRSIGLAVSRDGIDWRRTDGRGRTGAMAGPILTPTFEGPKEQTNWEFLRSDDPFSGSVGAPMVALDRGPIREVYIMYYTGNLRGNLEILRDPVDTSIGVAFSLDGIRFEKASTEVSWPDVANEVNPVLNEIFPLCVNQDDLFCALFALQPFFDLVHGPGGFCTRPENAHHPACERFDPGEGTPGSGSSNSAQAFLAVDEAEPCVVRLEDDRYILFYHQQSNVFTLFDGGIAAALNNF